VEEAMARLGRQKRLKRNVVALCDFMVFSPFPQRISLQRIEGNKGNRTQKSEVKGKISFDGLFSVQTSVTI
jgi:hypothetical protein